MLNCLDPGPKKSVLGFASSSNTSWKCNRWWIDSYSKSCFSKEGRCRVCCWWWVSSKSPNKSWSVRVCHREHDKVFLIFFERRCFWISVGSYLMFTIFSVVRGPEFFLWVLEIFRFPSQGMLHGALLCIWLVLFVSLSLMCCRYLQTCRGRDLAISVKEGVDTLLMYLYRARNCVDDMERLASSENCCVVVWIAFYFSLN